MIRSLRSRVPDIPLRILQTPHHPWWLARTRGKIARFSTEVHFRHRQGSRRFGMKAAQGESPLAESASAALLELHDLRCTESISGILRRAFVAVNADEGTIWLLDEKQEALIPVWSSG